MKIVEHKMFETQQLIELGGDGIIDEKNFLYTFILYKTSIRMNQLRKIRF